MKSLVFTPTDRAILASYSLMLDGLAAYLGNGYEFVLHSLEDLNRSVVKIINGHHTGRKVGSPITDLALSMLDQIQESGRAEYVCYFTNNRTGAPVKSTTIAIRGENARIIGLLCINFYLNTPLQAFLSDFISHPADAPALSENFAVDSNDLIRETTLQVKQRVDQDESISVSRKNKKIVLELEAQGIFHMKNAVETVAELLNISKNTVYLHLRKSKRSNKP